MKNTKTLVLFFVLLSSSLSAYSEVKNQDKIFLKMLEILCKDGHFSDYKERFRTANDYKHRLIVLNQGTPILLTEIKDGFVVASKDQIEINDVYFY